MKIFMSLVLSFVLFSSVNGKERTFTGSTPANSVVRSFLEIPQSDSIDFIRWKIRILENKYHLSANFGIGKPNTNGFYNGGKLKEISGSFYEEENFIWLRHKNKSLGLAKLNNGILHFLDVNRSLMAGNGGWSYSLNNPGESISDELKFKTRLVLLSDSMTFQGRTPCLDFADIRNTKDCYKLKWSIVLYADPGTNKPTRFKLNGTAVKHNSRTGKWTGDWIKSPDEQGQVIYQLNLDNGKPLYFLLLENILVLTDEHGKLHVGNGDFSFTLSRKS